MLHIDIKYFPTEAGEIFSSEHYPLGNDMYLVKKNKKACYTLTLNIFQLRRGKLKAAEFDQSVRRWSCSSFGGERIDREMLIRMNMTIDDEAVTQLQ